MSFSELLVLPLFHYFLCFWIGFGLGIAALAWEIYRAGKARGEW